MYLEQLWEIRVKLGETLCSWLNLEKATKRTNTLDADCQPRTAGSCALYAPPATPTSSLWQCSGCHISWTETKLRQVAIRFPSKKDLLSKSGDHFEQTGVGSVYIHQRPAEYRASSEVAVAKVTVIYVWAAPLTGSRECQSHHGPNGGKEAKLSHFIICHQLISQMFLLYARRAWIQNIPTTLLVLKPPLVKISLQDAIVMVISLDWLFFKGDRRDVCMQMHHTHAHRLMINPTCVSTIIDPKVKAPLNANVLCNNAAHKLLSYPCSLAHSQSHPHLNGDLGLYCYSLVDGASRLPPLLLSLWDTNQQRDASGVPICPHCNKHRCFKSAEWRDQTAALRDKEKVLLLCPSGASHLHGMQRWLIFLDWNHLFYKANFRESWGLKGLLYLCHTERKQAPRQFNSQFFCHLQ